MCESRTSIFFLVDKTAAASLDKPGEKLNLPAKNTVLSIFLQGKLSIQVKLWLMTTINWEFSVLYLPITHVAKIKL